MNGPDNFVAIINDMGANRRPLSYFDLSAEYGKLRNSHDDLLAVAEAVKACILRDNVVSATVQVALDCAIAKAKSG